MVIDQTFPDLYGWLIVASLVVNLTLGGLIFLDSPRRTINRVFGLLCLMLTFWGIGFLGLLLVNNLHAAEAWARLYTCSLMMIPPLFYHLILGSMGKETIKSIANGFSSVFERIKRIAYVFGLGAVFLIATGFLPQNVKRIPGLYFPQAGGGLWGAMLVYGALAAVGAFLLFRQYARAQDQAQRSRLTSILMGAGAALIGCTMNFLSVNSDKLQTAWILPLGHFSTSFCLVLIAFAITTYQLSNVSELTRTSLAYFIMAGVLLFVFGSSLELTRHYLAWVPHVETLALLTSSVIMALLFHPLRYKIQNLADNVFFKSRFDQLTHLKEFDRKVLTVYSREDLTRSLMKNLTEMGFGSIGLLLKDSGRPVFQAKASSGFTTATPALPELKEDSLLVQYLKEEKEGFVRDEIPRRILIDWERQSLSQDMDAYSAEACFPMFSVRRKALFGILTLGKSELAYASYKGRNLFWLNSVIDKASIMFENFSHAEFENALIPYVGREQAEEIRKNKDDFRDSLSGQRMWVSVLMIDIRRFMPLAQEVSPTELVKILQEYRHAMTAIVHEHQGVVDKFIGDAIMAEFGVPILPPLANPDENAVRCALAMQAKMKELNEQGRFGSREIQTGVGIGSGNVVLGNVDSGDRVEYTAMGDAVNMSARLEDIAGNGEVVISDETFDRVKDLVDVKSTARPIYGKKHVVTVHQVLGLKTRFESFQGENPRQAVNQ
jgi:class 3 adenylate cyclase